MNPGHEQVVEKLVEKAAEIDAAEDERYGDARGDELPPTVARREGAKRGCARLISGIRDRQAVYAARATGGQGQQTDPDAGC